MNFSQIEKKLDQINERLDKLCMTLIDKKICSLYIHH